MSVFAGDTIARPATGSIALRRPAWLLSVLVDALLGASAYLASYWLRFDSERLATFLPAAWSTVPLVVGAQILALTAVRSRPCARTPPNPVRAGYPG
jgi:hypothetical protein